MYGDQGESKPGASSYTRGSVSLRDNTTLELRRSWDECESLPTPPPSPRQLPINAAIIASRLGAAGATGTRGAYTDGRGSAGMAAAGTGAGTGTGNGTGTGTSTGTATGAWFNPRAPLTA